MPFARKPFPTRVRCPSKADTKTFDDTKTSDLLVGGGIEDGWMGLDSGPETWDLFRQDLSDATKIMFY